MKRLYILSASSAAYGPFDWKLVRTLFGYGLIEGYYVRNEGTEDVLLPKDHSKIGALPKSVAAEIARYKNMSVPTGFTTLQQSTFEKLGLPPFSGVANRYVGRDIIEAALNGGTECLDPQTRWRLRIDCCYGWKTDPASDAQKEFLRSTGIKFRASLTKGEASCLMDPPATDAQRRRLSFYSCNNISNLTKKEASEIIDSYIQAFPESETAYQAAKAAGAFASC